ncbi:MAG: hypothetical protein LWW85_03335 [Marinilabiliales bacterium]|nr:hypothetical protein [Marinilabiliales bacterium]
MRIVLLFLCLSLFILPMYGADTAKETPLSWYGFIRNDFYLDTYKGYNSMNDLFYTFPNYGGKDGTGQDINRQLSANLLSIVTRFGVNYTGPTVLGAQLSGCVEADFAGKPEVYLLRLRKAYVTFRWHRETLLVGQTWHPFGGGEVYPIVPSLNTGAPFRPFSRAPIVRFDHHWKSFTASLSGCYQQQYLSYGPLGASNTYKRDAALPEIVAGIDFTRNGLSLGANLDYNTLKPRVTTTGSDGKIYNAATLQSSLSGMVYAKYAGKKVNLLFQGYLGQNLAHLTLNSGYGISAFDPVRGTEHYTNYNGLYTVFNMTYGTIWRPGILLGYSKNLGTSDPLYKFTNGVNESATIWGSNTGIQHAWRISPFLSYLVSKYQLSLEYELTAANYGTGAFNFENGLYGETHDTFNHGITVIMTCFF